MKPGCFNTEINGDERALNALLGTTATTRVLLILLATVLCTVAIRAMLLFEKLLLFSDLR